MCEVGFTIIIGGNGMGPNIYETNGIIYSNRPLSIEFAIITVIISLQFVYKNITVIDCQYH